MGRNDWIRGAVIGLVALLVLLVATSLMVPRSGWAGGRMGPGMMGGWRVLGWLWVLLVPLTFATVLVLGLFCLPRQTSAPSAGGNPTGLAVPCPHCGRFVQVGWRACPYCGRALVAEGPPDEAAQ